MLLDISLNLLLLVFLSLNAMLAMLFWLHDKLETSKLVKLRYAVNKAVRSVEQVCEGLESPEKKNEAIARVQAFLGLYRWMIPALVIDTAIEAELFLIRQMDKELNDSDMSKKTKRRSSSAPNKSS